MRRFSLVAGVLLLVGCGGGDDRVTDGPRVDLIADAIDAIEAHYGSPQEYFEVSAGLDSVEFVVAVDGATAGERGSLAADGTFVEPIPVGKADGVTFTADSIAVDPDLIFDQLRDELDDPVIVDLAMQGGPDGTVIYDATVATDGGGVLLVLLGPDGTILGAQGA